MVVRDRSFPSGSPVCDYWLSRCEGFTVRAGSRNLGVVERLAFAAPGARVDTLVVRKRHHRSRPLHTGQVLAVVPARRLLLARRDRHNLPDARPAADALGRGARSGAILLARFLAFATPIVAAAVRAAAVLAGRTSVRLLRASRDGIREYHRKLAAGAARTHQMQSAKLEHAHTVANEYAFGLGHDCLEVGREEQPSPALDQA